MMRSLYSGVAGLKAHQTGMDVVGNNIANVNTTGFKSFRATYQDTLYQTSSGAAAPQDNKGGVNPIQVGLGVGNASIDKMFKDGSVQTTSSNTDLCLSGDGLFIVQDGSGVYYTRNGAFKFDGQGNYVNSAGQYVQGWMGVDGEVNTNSAAGKICIPSGKPMAAEATTQAKYDKNLNAAAAMVTKITKSDGTSAGSPAEASAAAPLTLTMSDGTAVTVTSGVYQANYSLPLTTTLTIYDSLGNDYTIPVMMSKNGTTGDKWSVYIESDTGGIGGTKTFYEEDGTTEKIAVTIDKFDVVFNKDGSYKSGSGKMTFSPKGSGEAAEGTVAIDVTGLTQYAGSNTVNGACDGNAAGTLVEVNIDSSGTITGTYSNGINQKEAVVAVAQFNNAGGLTAKGASLFQKSNNSGEPNVKTASDLGCTITASALEMSNVDLANEFSTMIVTQRGYQSNSKVITVSDEMLETLINMKR
ncbi:MAG: flagellar hook protein FlgE [Selenomonadaceae bacterium]|nr:flagellar hook protein FlgE [Selenomonadaceae bacterium]